MPSKKLKSKLLYVFGCLFFTFIFSSPLQAKKYPFLTQSKQVRAFKTQKWLEGEWKKILPADIAKSWIVGYKFIYQTKRYSCFQMVREGAFPVVEVNLARFPWSLDQSIYQKKRQIEKSRCAQELTFLAVKIWSQDRGKVDRLFVDEDLREFLYKQNFFHTPWTMPRFEFDSGLDQIYLSFWQRSLYHYLTEKNFPLIQPRLYQFLKERIFDHKEYFVSKSLNLEKWIEHKPMLKNRGKVQFLRKNNEALWARVKLIEEAKESIYMTYFSFFEDFVGKSLMGLLAKKIKEGVKVKIMVDKRGGFSSARGDYFQELVALGADVRTYNPWLHWTNWWKPLQMGLLTSFMASNHDKILLVDKKYLITGGRNIGTKYFVESQEYSKRVFTDLDVYIEFEKLPISVLKSFLFEFYGTLSLKLNADLLGNWKSREKEIQAHYRALKERMTRKTLTQKTKKSFPELEKYGSLYQKKKFRFTPQSEWVDVQGIDNTSSYTSIQENTQILFEKLKEAKKYVYIQNPYLILTPPMGRIIDGLCQKGVKVIFHVPSPVSTDSYLTQAYLLKNWRKILRRYPCSRMYGFLGPTQLHSKVITIDGEYAFIGSYNMDPLSQNINGEFSVLITSAPWAQILEENIQDMIENRSFAYDAEKGIGPAQVPKGKKAYQKTKKFYWLSGLFHKYL